MSRLTDRNWLLLILLGAFALRAASAVGLQHWLDGQPGQNFLIEGDANGYWDLGNRLAAGESYETHLPPRKVLRMPGFPALLAIPIRLCEALGLQQHVFLVARFMLAGVGTLACGLVYWLGCELFDKKTALVAAGLTACLPAMVGFSVVILSETMFAAALLASLIAMARLTKVGFDRDRLMTSTWLSLTVGAFVAAACMVRPSWLLIGPGFACLYWFFADNRKRATVNAVLMMVGLGAVMFPWALRNHRVTGHWVMTTLWVGPSLYDGLNPNATGDSDMTFIRTDDLTVRLSEYEVDQHYRQKAWQFVAENPVRTIELAFVKLARFWKPWPNAAQFQSGWLRAGICLSSVLMIVLAVRGWWVSRGDVWPTILTVGPILYFAAIHMIFVSSLRYRLPTEYPLCLLVAVGITSWFQSGNSQSSQTA